MTSFAQLKLSEPVLQAVLSEKYETPTPIQAQTIPHALAGRDVLGCAQTGTGKTAAFALPILDRLGRRNSKAVPHCPRALILAPTRELAVQIHESMTTYGKNLRLRQTLVYGGVSQMRQVRAMKRGAHVLVATPGRLLDLMYQSHFSLEQLEVFVLDEADRMLDMGFLPDLKRIISALPVERQSLFFSATMPDSISQLSRQLLQDPIRVSVTPPASTVDQIDQRVAWMAKHQKRDILKRFLRSDQVGQTLVFMRTKRGANFIAEHLCTNGIQASAIHGNKSQNARQRALDEFRNAEVQVLVATDVAARGIDIDGISHVVNFEMPHEPESYVHRIGRTGRAGASGVALSFCEPGERGNLLAIERLIGQQIPIDADYSQDVPKGSDRVRSQQANRQRRHFGGQKSSSGQDGDGKARRSRPRRRRKPAARG